MVPLLESHKAKVRSSEIGILTPAEFARLLESLKSQATKRCPIGRSADSQVCAPPSSNGWTGQRSILIFDSDLVEVKATKQKPPHVGEVPLTREFETTITAIETKNDRSLES